jgi:hypothetical protein
MGPVKHTSWLSTWWSPRSSVRETEAADFELLLRRLLGRAMEALEPIVRVSFETGAVMRDMVATEYGTRRHNG